MISKHCSGRLVSGTEIIKLCKKRGRLAHYHVCVPAASVGGALFLLIRPYCWRTKQPTFIRACRYTCFSQEHVKQYKHTITICWLKCIYILYDNWQSDLCTAWA